MGLGAVSQYEQCSCRRLKRCGFEHVPRIDELVVGLRRNLDLPIIGIVLHVDSKIATHRRSSNASARRPVVGINDHRT